MTCRIVCMVVSEVLLCPRTQLTWLARAITTFQFLGLISGNGRDYCKDNPYFHLNYIYFELKTSLPDPTLSKNIWRSEICRLREGGGGVIHFQTEVFN